MTLYYADTENPSQMQPIPTDRPFVSVVVPVLNDDARLGMCLDGLTRQSYPADRYEVLVVDNGSERPIREVTARYPGVSCLSEARPGSYAARNAAIKDARGELIAFTDADCVPAEDWIERAAGHWRTLPRRTILAGRISRTAVDDRELSAVELYDRTFFLRQDHYAQRHGWAVTANLFAPGAAFRSVGAFNPGLRSGGDFEWTSRARMRGFTIRYVDDVVVWHPTIDSLGALIRKARRVAGANVALQRARRPGVAVEMLGVARELGEVVPKWRQFHAEHRELRGAVAVSVAATIGIVQLARAAERIRIMAGGSPRGQ